MRKNSWTLILLFVCAILNAQTATDIIKSVHKKYYQGSCKIYTFSQKNTLYKNDTVSGHSEWYEAIEFRDKFRIDFGNRQAGNFVIIKNDSAFNYKKSELVSVRSDSSTLLLLLGGMFYRKLDDVLNRMRNANYNTKILSIQKWNNEETYVVGAKENDLASNQVWINKKTLRVILPISRKKLTF